MICNGDNSMITKIVLELFEILLRLILSSHCIRFVKLLERKNGVKASCWWDV